MEARFGWCVAGLAGLAGLAACGGSGEPTGPAHGIHIRVAPLQLDGIDFACYDLLIQNEDVETVISRGDPAVNLLSPSPDMETLCSTQFGNGPGGDISYVAPCDAQRPSHTVTVWVDGLYTGTPASPVAVSYQDPCPTGCVLPVVCVENADTPVTFNLTVLRPANQGFFDIAVNFDAIFCSAKVDCEYGPDQPIELVFDPVTKERVQTVVWAFACTDGDPGGDVQASTHLYMDDLVLDCVDGVGTHTLYTVSPSGGPGNIFSVNDPAPAPFVQVMVFEGREAIQNAGEDADKLYWNVAMGLNMAFFQPPTGVPPTCTLRTSATASRGPLEDHTTPANATYPWVRVEVAINNGASIACTRHPLNGLAPNDGVATDYTELPATGATRRAFSHVASLVAGELVTTPVDDAVTPSCEIDLCLFGTCVMDAGTPTCVCDPGWTGELCTQDENGCAPLGLCAGQGCVDVAAPGVGHTCVPCSPGYVSRDGQCQANGVPAGDPYLTYTHTEAWQAHPYHGLESLYGSSAYYFPDTYGTASQKALVDARASERVIFNDLHTGAEVWLLKRNPDDEDVWYTNEKRFNSNGSAIRVGSFVPSSVKDFNGGALSGGSANIVIPSNGERPGAPGFPFRFTQALAMWHPSDPALFVADSPVTAPTARHLANVNVPWPPSPPVLFGLPGSGAGQTRDLSQDYRYYGVVPTFQTSPWQISVYESPTVAPQAPTYGTPRVFDVTVEACPGAVNRIGTTEFLTDPDGKVYFRYSLNKGEDPWNDATHTCDPIPTDGRKYNPTPYQNWMIDVDDPTGTAIRLTSQSVPVSDPDKLLLSISEVRSGGHGAYSPSLSFQAIHKGECKRIRDFRTQGAWQLYDLDLYMERCDHMDWSQRDSQLFIWARSHGTPIYRVETHIDANNRMKAKDVFRVVAPQACQSNYHTDVYQNSSPDGTKVLYGSNMLSSKPCPPRKDQTDADTYEANFEKKLMTYTRDLYMAIVERPRPPQALSVGTSGDDVILEWTRALRTKSHMPVPETTELARETAGYHVYRSTTSGRGYVRLTTTPVPEPVSGTAVSWVDADAPANAYYVVTTVDHAGVESRTYSPEAALAWSADVRVYWEAEDGELGPRMRTLFFPAAASGQFAVARGIHDVDRDLVQGIGRATWRVKVPKSAAYGLWARVRSRTGEAASATVGVGRDDVRTLTVTGDAWTWVRVGPATLKQLPAGDVLVWFASSDSRVELDAWLWTTEATPTGFERLPVFATEMEVQWVADSASTQSIAGELRSGNTRALVAWDDPRCISHSDETKPPVVCYAANVVGTAAFLEWQAFGPTTHHYQVYRRLGADPEPSVAYLVGSPARPTFVDPNLSPGTYHYRIQAVDAWGQVSEPSESRTVTIGP